MLILRAALGVTLLIQGSYCAVGHGAAEELLLGTIEILCGALLTVGPFTPIASVMTIIIAGIGVLVSANCKPNLFDAKLSIVFAGVLLAAVLLVGPGAFSIDARVFGRREIIIPPSSRSRSTK